MTDLYPKTLDSALSSEFYDNIQSQFEKIDKKLHKLHGKKKSGKKGKKKKLKKQIEKLEKDQELLFSFLQGFAQHQQFMMSQCAVTQYAVPQYMAQQEPTWWQNAIVKGLPHLLDMGKVVLNNATKPRPQILPARSQLYLTDCSERK